MGQTKRYEFVKIVEPGRGRNVTEIVRIWAPHNRLQDAGQAGFPIKLARKSLHAGIYSVFDVNTSKLSGSGRGRPSVGPIGHSFPLSRAPRSLGHACARRGVSECSRG
eukprot:scaffold302_cov397-Prasinococcus_capsulatus_cf.AAC.12